MGPAVKRWLTTRCDGLLEVNLDSNAEAGSRYKLDFLHRIFNDYLQSPRSRETLKSWVAIDFDAKLYLCRALLAQTKSLPWTSRYLWQPEKRRDFCQLIDDFMHYSRAAETEWEISDIAVMDALDRVVSYKSGSYAHHWTNYIKKNDDFDDEAGGKTFLTLVIEQSLQIYVTQKLEAQPLLIQ